MGRGVIINTASVAAYEGQMDRQPTALPRRNRRYDTANRARPVHDWYSRNTIAPGMINTPFLQVCRRIRRFAISGGVVSTTIGTPEEIGKLALAIIDNYINGETILYDGGICMQLVKKRTHMRKIMSEPAVLTKVADGVMTITINRPQAKNAVNKDVAVGIAAALDALDADDNTHVVILISAGGNSARVWISRPS